MKKTIGILGGMGPEATSFFFNQLIKRTKAAEDQEHIKVIIYNNPEIPPRTDAILGNGPSPLPYLIEGVRMLHQAGADFIVMPCVTAHYYYNDILAKEKVSFLNLLDETLLYTLRKLPGVKRVGLIASTGTVKSRLFHDVFAKQGIEVTAPNDDEQQLVVEAIFGKQGIKAGIIFSGPKEIILQTARALIERGAEAIIAGCTEVPLVLKKDDIPVPLIDPVQILVEVCILKAGYGIKEE